MLFVHEGTGVCDTIFGPLRYGPGDYLVLPIGTTWRLDPDAGSTAAHPVPRGAVGDRAAQALSQRLRPAARARAVLAARPPCPRRGRAARRRGRLRHPRPLDRPDHGLPLPAPPVRPRRLGRLPVAVPLRHRRLPADHRAGPPAAAGPPDVPGAELRGLLVRAAQVRLPPAGDPGAVQPLEHQLGRGHLLRRRQLHEPARRGDRVVHAPPGGHPARTASRARSRRRSARRRPRSWRSWSTRSTRSTITQAAMDLDDGALPVQLAAARGRRRRGLASSASAARRRSRTDVLRRVGTGRAVASRNRTSGERLDGRVGSALGAPAPVDTVGRELPSGEPLIVARLRAGRGARVCSSARSTPWSRRGARAGAVSRPRARVSAGTGRPAPTRRSRRRRCPARPAARSSRRRTSGIERIDGRPVAGELGDDDRDDRARPRAAHGLRVVRGLRHPVPGRDRRDAALDGHLRL